MTADEILNSNNNNIDSYDYDKDDVYLIIYLHSGYNLNEYPKRILKNSSILFIYFFQAHLE